MTTHRLQPAPLCSIVVCLLAASHLSTDGATPTNSDRFLAVNGTTLRDHRGTGKVVQLRGVNLGGWLEWQEWMCPTDSSKTLRDANAGHNGYNFEVRKLLGKRFGPKTANDLLATYQDNWIAARDLDNIKSLGLNVVRLTFGHDTFIGDDGQWRPDAFVRIDWLIREAWQRGLYTILDYHAFLPPSANQDGGERAYWSNAAATAETVEIWTRIAARYRDNPAVAFHDLLNEPVNSQLHQQPAPKASLVCDLYDRLYKAIRKVDPNHPIAMEGLWDWKSLRDPNQAGYRNVIYSLHWYNWGAKTTADRNRATDRDIQTVMDLYRTWNVPVFIGEFNVFGDADAWKYAIEQYDKNGLSWTLWTYKNKASGSNSWGVFNTIPGKAPPIPNLVTDSAEEIRKKWQAWATSPATFAVNPMFAPLLKPGD